MQGGLSSGAAVLTIIENNELCVLGLHIVHVATHEDYIIEMESVDGRR